METRTQRRRLREAGATLAIATGLVMGAMGGSAFAGQGSNQCSNGVCEQNYGGYGSSYHYVSTHSNGNGEYHNFSTYPYGGRTDRP